MNKHCCLNYFVQYDYEHVCVCVHITRVKVCVSHSTGVEVRTSSGVCSPSTLFETRSLVHSGRRAGICAVDVPSPSLLSLWEC